MRKNSREEEAIVEALNKKARAEHRPNREYKASVFVDLFSEPALLIELYNALAGMDFPPDTPIEIATLDDALFRDRVNDLAFVLAGRLVILVEHQSTVNENMPMRFLIYIGRVYEKILEGDALYRRDLIKAPRPEFIVLYNGPDELPDRMTLKLSDAFIDAPELAKAVPLELEVMVYNVNEGRNEGMTRRSETLHGYVVFIAKVREGTEAGLPLDEALTKAIDYCTNTGILEKYLKSRGSEVRNMLTQEWDWDKALRISREEGEARGMARGVAQGMAQGMAQGIAQGVTQGMAQGVTQGMAQIVSQMLANKCSLEQIAKMTSLPMERVKSLASQ
jgi:hypothetical protein